MGNLRKKFQTSISNSGQEIQVFPIRYSFPYNFGKFLPSFSLILAKVSSVSRWNEWMVPAMLSRSR